MKRNSRKAATGDVETTGHRVKRIRTENPLKAGVITRLQEQTQNTLSQPTQTDGSIGMDCVDVMAVEEVPCASNVFESSPRAISSNIQDSSHPTTTEVESPPEVSANDSRGTGLTTPESPLEKNVAINFSSAPSNPGGLAIWVARRISQFEVGDRPSEGINSEHDHSRRSSLSHPPGAHTRRKSDAGADAATVAERDKKRDENRKRKQSWRTRHHERNKDNDLRGRLNLRAREIYGDKASTAKTAFLEFEFNKRREKRARKEKNERDFPGFTLDPKLVTKLFPTQNTHLSSETNAAGTLFLNSLQGVRDASNREAAAALKAALQDADANSTPFMEALRILGTSSEVTNAINLTMRDYIDPPHIDIESNNTNFVQISVNDAGNTSNRPESNHAAMQTSGIRGGTNTLFNPGPYQPKPNVIKAIEAATSILHDIAGGSSDTYVTPYANPPPSNNQNSSIISNGAASQGVSDIVDPRKAVVGDALDKSDIDDFLKLAAGGSMSDEEDDAMSNAPENTSAPGDQTAISQPDGDVGATLQRIINELMAERNGSQNAVHVDDRQKLPLGTSKTSLYGSTTAKDQAAALKRLFSQAGVSINTIIPAEQSRATSQLYAHLSSRANTFPTSGGGINPSHASAYGNTAQMTQRMLARPGTSPQALQAAPSASRGNVVGPPVRARNAEELRKIQEYGFPPLPGSRPGQKRKH